MPLKTPDKHLSNENLDIELLRPETTTASLGINSKLINPRRGDLSNYGMSFRRREGRYLNAFVKSRRTPFLRSCCGPDSDRERYRSFS